jgi:hypothetical protein
MGSYIEQTDVLVLALTRGVHRNQQKAPEIRAQLKP